MLFTGTFLLGLPCASRAANQMLVAVNPGQPQDMQVFLQVFMRGDSRNRSMANLGLHAVRPGNPCPPEIEDMPTIFP